MKKKEKADKLLVVKDLCVSFRTEHGMIEAVRNLSFELKRGETLALVGESGSGKSTTALSLLGFRQTGPDLKVKGSIHFKNKAGETLPLHEYGQRAWQLLRGREIAMIFQNPARALNPLLPCGEQLAETVKQLEGLKGYALEERMQELLSQVQLAGFNRIFTAFPHQLSGGQQQRFMLALALAGRPSLLLADEPTSALDRAVEKEIVGLLKKLQKQLELSLLFITHDLRLVRQLANRTLVLRKGRCVEHSPTTTLFDHPSTAYTAQLLYSRPPHDTQLHRLPEEKDIQTLFDTHGGRWPENGVKQLYARLKLSPNASRPEKRQADFRIQNLSISYGHGKRKRRIVENISFSLQHGTTLGLMGPSGTGKSSIARALLRLIPVESGNFWHGKTNLFALTPERWRKQCRKYQMIFQDPYSSLNPRHRIEQILTEPLLFLQLNKTAGEARRQAVKMLRQVGLEEQHMSRLPHQFSGGQRQRIALARALLMQPDLLICDECVSALDSTVQAKVLNLIKELQKQYHFACLFISHDEDVVHFMANEVLHLPPN